MNERWNELRMGVNMRTRVKTCVWSWVFRTCGIACVEVQWFCFGNVFGNRNDPKVQFTFSNLFGNTFEDLDDFKMYLHFVWFRESIFGSQALRDISLEIPSFD